jgi:hypothetical protein
MTKITNSNRTPKSTTKQPEPDAQALPDPAAEPLDPQPSDAETDSPQPEKERNDAYKRLRRAVGKKVSAQSSAIADALVKHTIEGNSSTARILVGIVDKKKRSRSQIKRVKMAALEAKPPESPAINLANDDPWTGHDDDKYSGDPESYRKKGIDADEKR